ncbi:MAG: hypothetical protein P8N09_12380 [Planctomycetota bacterium]|nr:hypothetical protein [Planctomycetota bacterium]
MLSSRTSATVLGAVLVAASIGLAACDPVVAHPVASLACFSLAFCAYALACFRMLSDERHGRTWSLGILIAVAVCCRLLALPATPSDDVHRYLWEGRVLSAGHDPYRLSPDSPDLAHLALSAPEHSEINHPDWPAIYMPFMQWWQRLVVGIIPEAWALKLSFLLAEAGLCIALLALLSLCGLPASRLLIYAWNPLTIFATANQGHHDVVAAALLIFALLLFMRRAPTTATAVFTCSVLAKGFALAVFPALLASRMARDSTNAENRQSLMRMAATAIFVFAALSLPFLIPDAQGDGKLAMFGSIQRFGTQMHTNDSLYAIARSLFSPQGARIAMAAVWSVVALTVIRRRESNPLHGCALLLGTLLLVLPTIHPWYLVILIPFLCFFPWWGWILLSGTTALTWLPQLEIQQTGQWVEWPAIKVLEYTPLFVWLALVAWKRLSGRTDQHS